MNITLRVIWFCKLHLIMFFCSRSIITRLEIRPVCNVASRKTASKFRQIFAENTTQARQVFTKSLFFALLNVRARSRNMTEHSALFTQLIQDTAKIYLYFCAMTKVNELRSNVLQAGTPPPPKKKPSHTYTKATPGSVSVHHSLSRHSDNDGDIRRRWQEYYSSL